MTRENIIEVKKLTIGYGREVVQKDLDFTVCRGEVFGILGGSGCGKSTLLKNMIGLYRPMLGEVVVMGENLTLAPPAKKRQLMRRFGVTYQSGALFTSMTVGENIALPLTEFTDLRGGKLRETVLSKLELVDLADAVDKMPSELSGGMRKRAGLARALALEPELLFFDEPSAGLDPITSASLDRLIMDLKTKLDTTVVIVTHELASVFAITDRVIMLREGAGGIVASGDPRELRQTADDEWVKAFLNRETWKQDHER